jgi:Glycosyl hydrolases family 39
VNQQPPDESSSLNRYKPGQPPTRPRGQSQNWDQRPFQQFSWNQQPAQPQGQSQSPWGQQPSDQTQWNQQPTQADGPQQDFAPSSWDQPPTQQFGQSPWQQPFDQTQWNQQATQFQPPPPLLPPQPPRRTFWRSYRQSRRAKIISIVVLILLIGSIALAVFHFSSSGPGGTPGGTATAGTGSQTPIVGGKVHITADFGGRQNHAHPIPSTFLGIGGLGLTNVINAAAPYLPQASLRLTRFGGFMSTVFPTPTSASNPALQSWSSVDNSLSIIQQNHLQPIITLSFSPSWLQPQNQNPPQTNNCQTGPTKGDPSHVRPTFITNGQDVGSQKWGQLAAQVVAHIDTSFPGLHPLYEIWNEPDGTAYWCEKYGDSTTTTGSERLAEYKALYAAAAPLMKQQAQQDGTQIQIGGPALAFPSARASVWIPALVDDPAIAPYLDFISYHQYEDGKSWTQLVARTQDLKTGYLAQFQLIASLVHAGHQPNAQSTPIYVDEYNGNDCAPHFCRNDSTYAPLWNSLFIADLLNTVTVQAPNHSIASSIPTGAVYFTWSSPPEQYCMFGELNANLDCTPGTNVQAYPQYYTYKLLGGPSFLNMADSGYVANSATTSIRGVFAAAFFTRGHDAILIVNTTGRGFATGNILAKNPGESPSTAMFYTLNKDNPQIASQQISLHQSNGALTATVVIPAYSAVAIAF